MPKYSKTRQDEHIEEVRRFLVIDPNISILKIKDRLANRKRAPIKLDKDYINKLSQKIKTGRTIRLNKYTVQTYLAKFEEKLSVADSILWNIVLNKSSSVQEKIKALAEIRRNSSELFERMFNAGIFTKKLGEIENERNLSLTQINVNIAEDELKQKEQNIKESIKRCIGRIAKLRKADRGNRDGKKK